MTRPLITLTAADLDGCRVFPAFMAETPLDVLCIHCGLILVDFKRGGTPEHAYEIQCDPRDYIRAWLGPRGEMFPWADRAHMVREFFVMEKTTLDEEGEVFDYEEVTIYCPTALAAAMVCAPALAQAFGKDTWERKENTWEKRDAN